MNELTALFFDLAARVPGGAICDIDRLITLK